MLPITLHTGVTKSTASSVSYKRKSTQRAPFDLPSFYAMYETVRDAGSSTATFGAFKTQCANLCVGNTWTDEIAYNRAYERFVDKVRDAVELGVLLAERRQAVDMIVNRFSTLRRAWLYLRAGRFVDFLRELDVPPKREHRGVTRTASYKASAWWLEYWFGWSPFLQDVYAAVELLDSDVPVAKVKAASGNRTRRDTSTSQLLEYTDYKMTVLIQAEVVVSNPMLFRAQQFGVLNPAAIAWELMPWSFLVDWVVPVGNYLRSFTDFAGITLRNGFYTRYMKGKGHRSRKSDGRLQIDDHGIAVKRVTGIPGPTITWTLPTRLSPTRAATAASLLVTQLVGR